MNCLKKTVLFLLQVAKKKIWFVATLPRTNPFVLKNNVNMIQIKRTINVIIEDLYYPPNYIRHFLKYASNWNRIIFKRVNCKIAFARKFMEISQKCVFNVPSTELDLFRVLVKDSENSFIQVEVDTEEEHSKEGSAVEKYVQKMSQKIHRIYSCNERTLVSVYKFLYIFTSTCFR